MEKNKQINKNEVTVKTSSVVESLEIANSMAIKSENSCEPIEVDIKSNNILAKLTEQIFLKPKKDIVDYNIVSEVLNSNIKNSMSNKNKTINFDEGKYKEDFLKYNDVIQEALSINDFVAPDVSQRIIKTFNNELLIYNNENLSSQNSHLEYIDRINEDKTEFINKIKENFQLVKKNIFELLEQNHDINLIYVEKGVGVITHIVDFYNNRCHIQYLRNDDIEDLDITTSPNKVICLDCTAIKEPHLILKNNFKNKKLILIVDLHHFSLINKISNEQSNSINDKIDKSILPTEEEFKKRAWKLKEEKGIKLTTALNELSKQYGFSCFNAIKPNLSKHIEEVVTTKTNPKDYQLSLIKSAIEHGVMPGYDNFDEYLEETKKFEESKKSINHHSYLGTLPRSGGEFSLKNYLKWAKDNNKTVVIKEAEETPKDS